MGERLLPIDQHPDEELPSIDDLLLQPELRARLKKSVDDDVGIGSGAIVDGKFILGQRLSYRSYIKELPNRSSFIFIKFMSKYICKF
jgi:hypothetical protein